MSGFSFELFRKPNTNIFEDISRIYNHGGWDGDDCHYSIAVADGAGKCYLFYLMYHQIGNEKIVQIVKKAYLPKLGPSHIIDSGELPNCHSFDQIEEYLNNTFNGAEYHYGLNDCRNVAKSIKSKFGSSASRLGWTIGRAGIAGTIAGIVDDNAVTGASNGIAYVAAHGVKQCAGIAGIPLTAPISGAHIIVGQVSKKICKNSDDAKHIGGTVAAVATGAYVGSVVPGIGTLFGATCGLTYGAVSWGIEKILS